MKIFTRIKKSIYDPQFYFELNEKPLSFSLKYIFSFAVVFGLLIMVQFALLTLPQFKASLDQAGPWIMDNYPEELKTTLINGELTTNVDEPYFISDLGVPDDLWKEKNMPSNMIVIDTQIGADVQYLKEYDTLILVTKTHVLYQDERGKITAQSFEKLPDGTISKESVGKFVEEYSPYIYVLIPLAFLGLFLFSFLYVTYNLAYLLFASLLIMLVAKLLKKQLGYAKSYQFGIHLLTLPILFTWFVPVGFPLMFTILLLVLAVLNLKEDKLNVVVTEE